MPRDRRYEGIAEVQRPVLNSVRNRFRQLRKIPAVNIPGANFYYEVRVNGKMTEGIPCRKKTEQQSTQQSKQKPAGAGKTVSAYSALQKALQQLNDAAKGCEGMANKDLLKYANRIESLAEE